MAALVDILARRLGERTGSEFTVLRGRVDGAMRYGLTATRDGHSYTFQAHRPMTIGELTRWLASILDMIDMGYIPCGKEIGQ